MCHYENRTTEEARKVVLKIFDEAKLTKEQSSYILNKLEFVYPHSWAFKMLAGRFIRG